MGGGYNFKIAYIKVGEWDCNTSGTSGSVNITDYIPDIDNICSVFVSPNWHVAATTVSLYDRVKFKYTVTNPSGPGFSATKDITALIIYF